MNAKLAEFSRHLNFFLNFQLWSKGMKIEHLFEYLTRAAFLCMINSRLPFFGFLFAHQLIEPASLKFHVLAENQP